MQDFTGVPAVVDLAAMRDAMDDLEGDPSKINPLVPAELVIDHSVQVDVFGTRDAFRHNAELEFERNQERYAFLRWGQGAFEGFKVVPPDTGIVHQVNLEYLARVVFPNDGDGPTPGLPRHAGRDRLAHHDDQRPRRPGLGRRRHRGRGGHARPGDVDADPAGRRLRADGELPEGATATDLVLTVTQMLREHGVVGKFVEFHGPGLANLPLADRATIGNMSPEFGSTCAIFPIDAETLRYLEFSGRPTEQIELVEAYAASRASGTTRAPRRRPSPKASSSTSAPSCPQPGRAQAPAGPRAALEGQGDVPRGADQLRRHRRRAHARERARRVARRDVSQL